MTRWQECILEQSNKKLAEEHQKKTSQTRERVTSLKNLHSSRVKKIVEMAEQPMTVATPVQAYSNNKSQFSRQISAHLPVAIKETDAFILGKILYYLPVALLEY